MLPFKINYRIEFLLATSLIHCQLNKFRSCPGSHPHMPELGSKEI